MMMDELIKNNLFEIGLNSWNFLNKNYEFKYFKQEKLTFVNNDTYSIDNLNFLNFNTLFSLVGETCTDKIFITEKTYLMLGNAMPFLVYGSQNQNNCLKKYGFELYDEIFDYSFDELPILEDRIQGVIKNLNNIKNKNWNEKFQSVKNKAFRNKKRHREILENDPFIPLEMIEMYKNNKNLFDETTYFSPNILKTIMKNKI